jgi:hypothetical protein
MENNCPNMKTTEDLFADTENTWDYPDEEDFYIDTQYVDGNQVEYEIIFGNEKIVFIKAGADHRFSGMLPQFIQTIDLVDDIG